jgi:hypothetical protein
MKGEDFVDQSPWPITWKQSVETALKRVDGVQRIQRTENWRNAKLPRRPAAKKEKVRDGKLLNRDIVVRTKAVFEADRV